MRQTDDDRVIAAFGREWGTFTHTAAEGEADLRSAFEAYLQVFPWHELPARAVGADVGCGTGRWARFVAPRVEKLYCVDPSAALDVARQLLAGTDNCEFTRAKADAMPIADHAHDRKRFFECLNGLSWLTKRHITGSQFSSGMGLILSIAHVEPLRIKSSPHQTTAKSSSSP